MSLRFSNFASWARLGRGLVPSLIACGLASGAVADPDLAAGFDGVEIVVLGEVHDNPLHHANQAQIVEALKPDALVFEMIEPARALAVTAEIRADADALAGTLAWQESGWPDFAMYYPIFAAAPEAAVFGGAAGRSDVRQAVADGAATVFGDAAALFGLDRALDAAELETRQQLQYDAHCGALPEELLPGMVEAQRLRDAALAKATVAALAHARAVSESPQVVVITGNGHAREDWGMPEMLARYFRDDPGVGIRTLAQFETDRPDAAPYSTWIATEAAERDDPCRAFAR